jgi:hypothetical protein
MFGFVVCAKKLAGQKMVGKRKAANSMRALMNTAEP